MKSETPTSWEANFAAQLHRRREARGGTVNAFLADLRARGVAWHATTLYRTEAGERPARLDEVRTVAGLLGVSFAEMVEPPAPIEVEAALAHAAETQDALRDAVRAFMSAQAAVADAADLAGALDWTTDRRVALALNTLVKWVVNETFREAMLLHERPTDESLADGDPVTRAAHLRRFWDANS